MSGYLVRHRERKTLLGLFVASDLDWLWDLVDEICDPFDYEWSRIANASLACHGPNEFATEDHYPAFEPADDDSDPDPEPRALHPDFPQPNGPDMRVMFSEYIDLKWGKRRWTPFDSAIEGHGVIARIARRVDEEAAENA